MGTKLKKLKRTGPPASSKAAAQPQKKKARGPKPFIQAAHEEDEEEDEDEEALRAMEAEEMLAGSDSDDDDGTSAASDEVKTKKSNANGKARATDANFLLSLDKKAISRSRAEEARLNKAERKAQRQEAGQEGPAASSSRARLDGNEDSDAESTDMEGASDDSDDDDDDGLEGIRASDSDFDSAQSFSDEEPTSEEDDSADDDEKAERAEARHAEILRARKRRERAEEAREMKDAKKRRLPVRGEEGKWQDEDDEDGEGSAAAAKTKSKKDTNRALRDVQMEEASSSEEEEDEEAAAAEAQRRAQPASTITSGARFGLQAPYTIMLSRPKSARIAAAREQIARLSTDIIGDPEVSLGLLRRLSVFAQEYIQRPEHDSMAKEQGLPTKVEVDASIRAAAILSLTAVFVDILPGYRIRALSEKEAAEKVNQETARRREWEQGLVDVYKVHLQACESVVRSKAAMVSSVALRSMCLLLTRATHFNFRTNLISAIVAQLSRKSWSDDSQQCAEALTEVLKRDLNGEVSLEVVRLLNRMIKERSYQVNAKVLNLLLNLRLKDELGQKRADTVRAGNGDDDKKRDGKRFQSGKGKAKPRDVQKGKGQHLSKKAVKQLREVKEVEKEMKEAQAEVDLEVRERNHTETLKLLFVLYFSILKAPAAPGALLGAALEGLSRFAHRVNTDFFRDLLAVLRNHITQARAAADGARVSGGDDGSDEDEDEEEISAADVEMRRESHLRRALLCLVTAFELLSGQGEALIIDLSDLVDHLYALVLPVCTIPSLEEVPQADTATPAPASAPTPGRGRAGGGFQTTTHLLRSTADLLLRSLDLCLLRPRPTTLPSERSAAFVKRLVIASLHTPAQTTLRLLGVARSVMGRDVKLEALLDTEDRAKNGSFDVEKDDAEAARPLAAGEVVAWELGVLARSVNEDVAEAARGLLAFRKV